MKEERKSAAKAVEEVVTLGGGLVGKRGAY